MILTLIYRNEALNRPIANKLSELYVAEGKAAPRIEEWLKEGLDLSTMVGDTLTLLDLSGDGYFQKYCCGEVFATELLNMALPPSVTTIEVIISDVLRGHSIDAFASALALNLNRASEGKNKAIVKAYSYKIINEYGITFIAPPSTDSENWRIYGAYRLRYGEKVPPDIELRIDKLLHIENKTLLWEGKDIRDSLQKYYPETGLGFASFGPEEPAGAKIMRAMTVATSSGISAVASSPEGSNKRNYDSLTPEKSIDDEFKTLELKEENSPKKPRITLVQPSAKNLINTSAEEKTNSSNNYSPRSR